MVEQPSMIQPVLIEGIHRIVYTLILKLVLSLGVMLTDAGLKPDLVGD